jgi:signal transduction histidine kinase
MTSHESPATEITRAQGHLEQALVALERLPATDSRAIAFATHALNNYLMVASASVLLIRRAPGENIDPAVEKLLSNLEHISRLMTFTVGRLTSTAVSKDMPLQPSEVALAPLVESICSYHQRAAGRKKIQVRFSQAGDVPSLWSDRVAIAAVLESLLSNAVKYTPEGKRVNVEIGGDKGSVYCTVQDEGPGISEVEQLQLFKPGIRLSSVPTGGESSSGYGLSVAKALIDILGGSIWCESSPGNGTCFGFRVGSLKREDHVPDQTK